MFTKLRNKTKSDEGNPIFILGIILIAVSLLVGGIMLDLTKAYQFKSSYIEAAKKATQAGIRIQDSEGNLTTGAIVETIRVYETISRPSVMKVSKDSYMSRCQVGGKKSGVYAPRDITIQLGTVSEDGSVRIGSEIENLNLDNMKYIRDNYIANPGAYSAQKINSEIRSVFPEIDKLKKQVASNQYNYIHMEIYESTPNTILPGAFAISGGNKDSILCQRLGVQASASQYIESNK